MSADLLHLPWCQRLDYDLLNTGALYSNQRSPQAQPPQQLRHLLLPGEFCDLQRRLTRSIRLVQVGVPRLVQELPD